MSQLSKRVLVLIFLVPICAFFIAIGGWLFAIFIAAILVLAGKEWVHIFEAAGYKSPVWLVMAGVGLLALTTQLQNPYWSDFVLIAYIFVATTYHLIQFERGRKTSGTDLLVTLSAMLYLGWLGSFFVKLRLLPSGDWWMLIALPAVWLADLGGFLIGRKWGKRLLARQTSPKKTWEGYLGGIVFGVALTPLLALLWKLRAPEIMVWHGALIGLAVAIIAPLGDLGESFIKRQVNVKDSSNLLPGHGGILDRIDSWLWAIPIAYFLLIVFIIK